MTTSCLECCDLTTILCYEKCWAPRKVDFASIEASIQTGDLLVAGANKTGRVAALNVLETCPWDHTALLYKHDDGTVYAIDSGSSRYYPELCRRPLYFGPGSTDDPEAWKMDGTGIQMYPLRQFIEMMNKKPLHVLPGKTHWYYDRMCVRHLREPLTPEELQKWRDAVMRYRDCPYEGGIKGEKIDGSEMTRAAIKICHCCHVMENKEEHRESLFCSEFVAAVYMDVGVLHPDHHQPADAFVPSDFTRHHGCNLSGLCCGCCCSWTLGVCCGVGDMRRFEQGRLQGKLFGPEVVLHNNRCDPALLVTVPEEGEDVAAGGQGATATTPPLTGLPRPAPESKDDMARE
eukprot:g4513.t1